MRNSDNKFVDHGLPPVVCSVCGSLVSVVIREKLDSPHAGRQNLFTGDFVAPQGCLSRDMTPCTDAVNLMLCVNTQTVLHSNRLY
jgi:hypothetical protein